MLDMYGNNFYFVPFFLFNFSMLLIMDHDPLVFLGWEGMAVGKLWGCESGSSPGCLLVNTHQMGHAENGGSKLGVFVWVYDNSILLSVRKNREKKVSGVLHHSFVLGHLWKLHAVFPSPAPFCSFSSFCFRFQCFWCWEKKKRGLSSRVPRQLRTSGRLPHAHSSPVWRSSGQGPWWERKGLDHGSSPPVFMISRSIPQSPYGNLQACTVHRAAPSTWTNNTQSLWWTNRPTVPETQTLQVSLQLSSAIFRPTTFHVFSLPLWEQGGLLVVPLPPSVV